MDLSKLSQEQLVELAEKGLKIKAREKKYAERARAKQMILVRKAIEAGLTVTEAELDKELKEMAKRAKARK